MSPAPSHRAAAAADRPGPAGAAAAVRLRPGAAAHRPQWVFNGGEGARLVLDGLFVRRRRLVLRGPFDHVKIVGCTFDPGTLADGEVTPGGAASAAVAAGFGGDGAHPERGPRAVLAVRQSVDGRALLPPVCIEPARAAWPLAGPTGS